MLLQKDLLVRKNLKILHEKKSQKNKKPKVDFFNFLLYIDGYVILIIEKGKARNIWSTLDNDKLKLYSISRSLLRVVGGYFLFLKIS